ncbi:MAG: thioester domain-containing protein [Streptosporangiales bacterium]
MAVGKQLCARLGAAALMAGAFGLVVSPSAAADGGATATYHGAKPGTEGHVWLKGRGTWDSTNVKLLESSSGGHTSTLETYCIDFDVEMADGHPKYQESDWDDFFKDSASAPRVNWILRNSYPALSINDLRKRVQDAPEFAGDDVAKLNPRTAAAGTQAAIWHFTNGADLAGGKNPEIVVDLYDYLTGKANGGVSNEPQVSLDISAKDDGELTAKPGEPFGPFTIETTSSNAVEASIESQTDGVHLVRKTDDGYQKVTELNDGDEFYVEVPADAKKGKATITAETIATVQVGRVFQGVPEPDKTQTLILAGSAQVHVAARAELTWKQRTPSSPTPSPTPSETGSNEAPAPTPVHTKAPVTG